MYQVEIAHEQGMFFTVRAPGGEFVVDARPKDKMDGGARGFNPLEVLLSGLGSCVGVYVRKYAEGAKLDLGNFKVRVAAELSGEPLISFRSITVDIGLQGSTLDERRQKALLEFVRNCPVHNTLKGNPAVEIKLSESR
ncbi:MAG: OsmC family protein [Candidatus Omnitrophica bacterium]|nr:OsmC family protein [Candidatus Omnitrophota bacterium]MDD5078156.1 OsmC family protein [Candidatus Omnitrophota bacterium]